MQAKQTDRAAAAKGGETVCELTPMDRIQLHWQCPWRSAHEARFHIAGILREFGIQVSA